MTTQLRLVDTDDLPTAQPATPAPGRSDPAVGDGESRATRSRRPRPAARVGRRGGATRRPARWHSEWRLDDQTRRVGQQGIAAARDALARARQADAQLPRAS